MKKVSLLLIIGICTLFVSSISFRQKNSSMEVFNTTVSNPDIKDYSIEELVEKFFDNKDVSITKKSETEFYINDSNYYLSYVNGDISYTHKRFNRSYQAALNNMILHTSLETMNDEYDTKEIDGITRGQALEEVWLVAHKLGLEIENEPYIIFGFERNLNNEIIEAFKIKTSWEQKEDCYYILWNDVLNTVAYKSINDYSSRYKNYGESHIGTSILAVVTKDGVIELEISKTYGSIQGAVQN